LFVFLIENEIDYYVLTNDSSRSPEQLAKSYLSKGIQAVTADRIISSGMLARDFLQYKIRRGTVAYLGTDNSAHFIQIPGIHTIPVSDVDLNHLEGLSALVFLDDEGFSWERDLNKVVNILRKKNIPVIVANTDAAYPVSRDEVSIAVGGLADMVERIVGKTFIRFGKPDAQMFMSAYEKVLAKGMVRKDQILMVGDTLTTDIIGGNKFGLDTVLVLTGNTLPAQAERTIAVSGIIPTYVCESVVV
jgi:HAD superfamily hydrolase (TIGR01450 family)